MVLRYGNLNFQVTATFVFCSSCMNFTYVLHQHIVINYCYNRVSPTPTKKATGVYMHCYLLLGWTCLLSPLLSFHLVSALHVHVHLLFAYKRHDNEKEHKMKREMTAHVYPHAAERNWLYIHTQDVPLSSNIARKKLVVQLGTKM